jgi:plasmid stabilization system protein ParE
MGAAQAWYESQSTGLGEEFVVAIELQLIRLQQEPLLYAEVIPKVRRALAPRFPYGLFYTIKGDLIHVLAVIHESRHPDLWPKSR